MLSVLADCCYARFSTINKGKPVKRIVFSTFISAVSFCSSAADLNTYDFGKLNNGLTYDEVYVIAGTPDYRSSHHGCASVRNAQEDVLIYSTLTRYGTTTSTTITLCAGKVVRVDRKY